MNTFIDEIKKMEKVVSKKLGENFRLFTVIRRRDLDDKWDIVVSADNLAEDKVVNEILLYRAKKMTPDSRVRIATVVFLDKNEVLVKKINKETGDILHADKEIYNRTYDDIYLSQAHVITSGSTISHITKKAG